MKVNNYFI